MRSVSGGSVAACAVFLAMVLGSVLCTGALGSADDALEKPVSVSWSGAKLTDCLGDLAKQTGAGFVLDPALAAEKRAARVTYAGTDVPLAVALGQALRAAGLRYTIRQGSVLISTPERLAREIVHGGRDFVAEAVPMSKGEALSLLSPADDDDDFPLSDVRQIHNKPWKQVEEATVNAETGLPDYPAPPVWIDSPDADSNRFKYTTRPSFAKPEHLPDPALLSGAGAGAGVQAQLDQEALGRLIAIIKAHPDWSSGRIIESFGEIQELGAAEEAPE